MRWMRAMLPAAAVLVMLSGAAAQAEDGVEIDCKKTDLKFDAPGFTVKCRDYSRSSISVGELNAASQTYSLFAMSEADITFLQAYSRRVLGGTRLFIHKRTLQADLEAAFSSKFTDWADEDDIGDFEIKRVTVTFDSGEPSECVAFRKLGAKRYEGVSGLMAGYACSGNGRDHAFDAVKRFAGAQE